MHSKQFYPSYIPSQWIHYTRHKKKRIRKKYQNRIRREVRRHKVDAQTLSFLLADASSRQTSVWEWCSSPPFLSFPQIKDVCNREAQQPALVGGSWRGNYALPLFSLSLPQIAIPPLPRLALPQITAPELESPAIEIPEIPETTQDALEKLGKALAELGRAARRSVPAGCGICHESY